MQTLLAVGGLAITLFLVVSTQESTVRIDRAKVVSEVETLAGHAALNVLSHIAAQPFDANTEAGTVDDDPNDLTPEGGFPTGRAFDAATDVDDFHQMAPYTYVSATDHLEFTVDATVRYVDEFGAAAGTQTFQKEVEVVVSHPSLPGPVTMSRIISWP